MSREGGVAVLKKYGREHFCRLGRKGAHHIAEMWIERRVVHEALDEVGVPVGSLAYRVGWLISEVETLRTALDHDARYLREEEEPYRYQPTMSYRDLERELASAHALLDRADVPRHSRSGTPWTVERRILWLTRRQRQGWPRFTCRECGLDLLDGCACTW